MSPTVRPNHNYSVLLGNKGVAQQTFPNQEEEYKNSKTTEGLQMFTAILVKWKSKNLCPTFKSSQSGQPVPVSFIAKHQDGGGVKVQ